METRELKKTELDELLELYSHLHESDDPLPEPSVVEAVWDRIQDFSYFRYFGVFIDANLVSSCALIIVPNLTRGCRSYGVIENVVTHRDYRGQGFGFAVVRQALAFALRENCYKVMLLTGRKSAAVYHFYESLGFDGQAKQAFLAKPG